MQAHDFEGACNSPAGIIRTAAAGACLRILVAWARYQALMEFQVINQLLAIYVSSNKKDECFNLQKNLIIIWICL